MAARLPHPKAVAAPSRTPSPQPVSNPVREDVGALYLRRCEERQGDPRLWKEFEPVDGDDWDMQATFSYCNWTVSRSKGAVSATSNWRFERKVIELPFQPSFVPKWRVAACETDESTEVAEPPQQAVRAFVATANGFLVGYNSGEWGGGLYSYAKSGDLLQEILVDNVIRIVKFRDGYLVFTGIAHMVTDRGEVVFLKRDRDGWRVAHRLDLTGMPRAFLDESEGSMLVATDDRIVRVTNGRRVEVLYGNRHRFWEAHSIVKDPDGTLYLGARYIVVRLRPRAVGYAETWLAPEGATRPRPPTE